MHGVGGDLTLEDLTGGGGGFLGPASHGSSGRRTLSGSRRALGLWVLGLARFQVLGP